MILKAMKMVLNEMKGIYPYEEDKADVTLHNSVYTMRENVVELRTKDELTGIQIIMSKDGTEYEKDILDEQRCAGGE